MIVSLGCFNDFLFPVDLDTGDIGVNRLQPEAACLLVHVLTQLEATDALGKAGIVVHPLGVGNLTTEGQPFDEKAINSGS